LSLWDVFLSSRERAILLQIPQKRGGTPWAVLVLRLTLHGSIAAIAVGLLVIRQAAADGRIEFASVVVVDALESYVEQVWNMLDHPEPLVTDLRTIGDFGLTDDECSAASDRLGCLCRMPTTVKKLRNVFVSWRRSK
jgi:hypothetical protein